MHTLGEAAQILHIGRVTLAKWLRRLDIEPERHPLDWRFRVLSDAQVEQIAATLRQLPGRSVVMGYTSAPSPSRLEAFVARYGGNLGVENDTTAQDAPKAPAPSQREIAHKADKHRKVVHVEALPDGLCSRTEAALAHNLPLTTVRRWAQEGRIETAAETFAGVSGRFSIAQPITTRGLAMLFQLANRRPDFISCPQCPHAWMSLSADLLHKERAEKENE